MTDEPVGVVGYYASNFAGSAHTGGRGHPGSGAYPTQRVSSDVMARAAQGRSEAGLCLRAVSDVQGQEPHRPSRRALPGPGGGQAFLPQASHTGRRGTRPRCVRDEDLDPLPVGRVQPGPQDRRRGALREEVPDEETSETRGAGRMEQRGPCCCSSTALACAGCAAMASATGSMSWAAMPATPLPQLRASIVCPRTQAGSAGTTRASTDATGLHGTITTYCYCSGSVFTARATDHHPHTLSTQGMAVCGALPLGGPWVSHDIRWYGKNAIVYR